MPLRDDEIQKLREDILSAVNSATSHKQVELMLNRFISHLESEQRISVEHGKKLDDHQTMIYGNSENEGLKAKVKTTEDYIRDRKTQNNAIMVMVIGLVIKAAWELLTKNS